MEKLYPNQKKAQRTFDLAFPDVDEEFRSDLAFLVSARRHTLPEAMKILAEKQEELGVKGGTDAGSAKTPQTAQQQGAAAATAGSSKRASAAAAAGPATAPNASKEATPPTEKRTDNPRRPTGPSSSTAREAASGLATTQHNSPPSSSAAAADTAGSTRRDGVDSASTYPAELPPVKKPLAGPSGARSQPNPPASTLAGVEPKVPTTPATGAGPSRPAERSKLEPLQPGAKPAAPGGTTRASQPSNAPTPPSNGTAAQRSPTPASSAAPKPGGRPAAADDDGGKEPVASGVSQPPARGKGGSPVQRPTPSPRGVGVASNTTGNADRLPSVSPAHSSGHTPTPPGRDSDKEDKAREQHTKRQREMVTYVYGDNAEGFEKDVFGRGKGQVIMFTTCMTPDLQVRDHCRALENLLFIKRIPYHSMDIADNAFLKRKMRQMYYAETQKNKCPSMPLLFVDKTFIGSYPTVQELEDDHMLLDRMKKAGYTPIEDDGDADHPDYFVKEVAAVRAAEAGDAAAAEALAKENAEREARAQAEREAIAQARAGQAAREAAEAAKAAKEKEEAERQAQEQAAKEKLERERLAKEQERLEKEKAERERIAKEIVERERAAKEKAKAERERAAKEKAERERMAKEKAEQERVAKEKAEQERAAQRQPPVTSLLQLQEANTPTLSNGSPERTPVHTRTTHEVYLDMPLWKKVLLNEPGTFVNSDGEMSPSPPHSPHTKKHKRDHGSRNGFSPSPEASLRPSVKATSSLRA